MTDDGPDVWELRWIAARLPPLADAPAFSRAGGAALRVVEEQDVYLLTGSDNINLKIRHRGNALKLKRLTERSADGFERWRTEFDAPLPAGRERFRIALNLLGKPGQEERLGLAASAGEAVALLGGVCGKGQIVTVYKTRHLFQRGSCRLDIVRFRSKGGDYSSMGVESSALDELRALAKELDLGRLGTPRNYMEFLGAL